MFRRPKVPLFPVPRLQMKPFLMVIFALTLSVPFVWAESTKNADGLWEFHPGDKIESGKVNENFATLSGQLQKIRDALVPAGTVIVFAGDTEPEGWMFCDGRALSRTEFAALFAAIGTNHGAPSGDEFNIPDYRGRFLRGVDGGSGRDPDGEQREPMAPAGRSGATVGSIQGDTFQGHQHMLGGAAEPLESGYSLGWDYAVTPENSPFDHGYSEAFEGSTELWSHYLDRALWPVEDVYGNGVPRTSSETRPANAAVYFLIKI